MHNLIRFNSPINASSEYVKKLKDTNNCRFRLYVKLYVNSTRKGSQGWSNVIWQNKWFSIVQSITNGFWLDSSAFKSYLLNLYQNWLVFPPLKTCIILVKVCITHCNTDYWCLEWSNVDIFWYWCGKYISYLMQVIMIRLCIIKVLKTLYLCTSSLEISHWNVHCFTPVRLVSVIMVH